MATVPTPLDPAPGDKNSASAFDAGVRDVGTFILSNKPRAHAYDNTGVVLTDGVDTLLALSGELSDNDNMHSTTTNTSRFTINTPGYYDIRIGVQLPAATYTVNNINARVNAAEVVGAGVGIGPFLSVTPRFIQASFFYQFALNDHFQIWINQTSGANRTTSVGAWRTFIQMIWVSN